MVLQSWTLVLVLWQEEFWEFCQRVHDVILSASEQGLANFFYTGPDVTDFRVRMPHRVSVVTLTLPWSCGCSHGQ